MFIGALLCSCAAKAPAPARLEESDVASAEAEEAVASREAVFTYGSSKNLAPRLTLKISGEPVLLPSGYVRLVGVVSGDRQVACLDIGGRGLALEKGEMVDDYRVSRVSADSVVLERSR